MGDFDVGDTVYFSGDGFTVTGEVVSFKMDEPMGCYVYHIKAHTHMPGVIFVVVEESLTAW